jgi:CRISPR/Cas system endoribonuclease Cas6 (RAMP superfamily)
MTLAFAERPQKSAARMQLIHTALRFIFSSQVLTEVCQRIYHAGLGNREYTDILWD